MSRKISVATTCPNCHSRDVWRWHREGAVMKHVAALLSWSLVTCRGCGNTFYRKTEGKNVETADGSRVRA